MSISSILAAVLALAALGFWLGRRRALARAGGDARTLHSRSVYHGFAVALATAVPALAALAAFALLAPIYAESRAAASLPEAVRQDPGGLDLARADMRRVADALDAAVASGVLTGEEARTLGAQDGRLAAALGSGVEPHELAAARSLRAGERAGRVVAAIVALGLAAGGLAYAHGRVSRGFRARNAVERAVLALLLAASTVAVATTLGIVLSMLFEALDFFSRYPAAEFFFGLDWSPEFRGGSDLGIVPLLWGTLYISLVALTVAVPIGLMSAIYMSEYATPRVRAVVKPLIEVLAGIPTIVYGLFALVTVGPLLRDWLAQPLGLGNSSSSVMTAGLVMGIMLIPFVSSLSDDVINAVPQSMRDGSLGLGATHSETIRRVVLPAALPGVVGAVLLAASRAIGETMIVVLGAGAAAKLDLNPFEAMTTVTVKIVSQLTGDTDFDSPETLVAFALGLTLFAMTLALNVLALWIVRRYREQYE